MTKRIGFVSAAALVAVAAMGASAVPASAETTLTAASCFPIGSPPSRSFEALVKEINAKGGDTVKIDLKGGAPAIGSPYTLTQKTARGAYDLVGCTEAYFGNVLPEAPVFRLANTTYAELRKNGAIDYMQGLLEAKNLHFIARHDDNGPFHLWLSKPIDQPDLTGLHMRVSPVYTPFFKALGATTQLSNIAQVYTYMENGTVQGFGWPAVGWVPGWIKVTKFRVDPGFYNATLHTVANLKAWKRDTRSRARGDQQDRPRLRSRRRTLRGEVQGQVQEAEGLDGQQGHEDDHLHRRRRREVVENGH